MQNIHLRLLADFLSHSASPVIHVWGYILLHNRYIIEYAYAAGFFFLTPCMRYSVREKKSVFLLSRRIVFVFFLVKTVITILAGGGYRKDVIFVR